MSLSHLRILYQTTKLEPVYENLRWSFWLQMRSQVMRIRRFLHGHRLERQSYIGRGKINIVPGLR